MSSILDFTDTSRGETLNKFTFRVDVDCNLRIEVLNNSVARLYFINDAGQKVDIPQGIVVYTADVMADVKRCVVQPHVNQEFILGWTDSYEITRYKSVILNIQTMRQWNITS